MPSEMDQVSRVVGGLEKAVESLTAQWLVKDREATDSRRMLYQEFSQVKDRFTQLTATVENLSIDVKEMQPAVRDWVLAKAMGLGAVAATSWIVRALWAGAIALLPLGGWIVGHFIK